ncbi:GntR family transcriptional regulator [Agromyces lapidis]|uniref:GntR family transcriptional regulator n=1 Tax=Agromyces lapidis TaxID=279574 RepID=A0ABV5STT1_9MICO|nr:GntR family transcriptional regulator [Agromyces lapidis]
MSPHSADTAVERVAEALRAEILSGTVALGSPLREEAAAERFGVSRHTVRSAFQRLVAERLAVAEAYRGVRVVSFDPDEIVALQQLRAALEGEAVRIAGERHGTTWPDAALAPAVAVLERLEEIAEAAPGARPPAVDAGAGTSSGTDTGDGIDWLEVERLHADFHRAVVAASSSPRIVEAHDALGSELLLFLLHVRPHYTLEGLIAEHRELLGAVQLRGAEAMREHLAHSTELLLRS